MRSRRYIEHDLVYTGRILGAHLAIDRNNGDYILKIRKPDTIAQDARIVDRGKLKDVIHTMAIMRYTAFFLAGTYPELREAMDRRIAECGSLGLAIDYQADIRYFLGENAA